MHRRAHRLVQLDAIIGMALNPVPLKHFTHILHASLWFSLSLSELIADISCKQSAQQMLAKSMTAYGSNRHRIAIQLCKLSMTAALLSLFNSIAMVIASKLCIYVV